MNDLQTTSATIAKKMDSTLANIISNTGKKTQKLAKEIMQNYPEYSYSYLKCTKWDYEKEEYTFLAGDEFEGDDVEEIIITPSQVAQVLGYIYMRMIAGEIRFDFLSIGTFYDAGEWDAELVDYAVQHVAFGEVTYG